MPEAQDKLAEYVAMKEALEKKLLEVGHKEAVSPFFTKLFAQYPTVEAVRWTQYAPYFNDGDPCVFRVHDTEARGEVDADQEDDDEWMNAWDDDTDVRAKAACEAREFFSKLGDTLMQQIFGADAQVTINRDLSVDIDEYAHD